MNVNYIAFLYILISLLYTQKAMCQEEAKSGYIITLKGDTLGGTIKFDPEEIDFTDSKNYKETHLEPKEIYGFVIDSTKYISFTTDYKNCFAEIKVDGDFVKLLYTKTVKHGTVYTDSYSRPIQTEDISEAYYLYFCADKDFKYLNDVAFNRSIRKLLKDYSALVQEIKEKKMKIDDVEYIINTYNTWKAGQL